MTKTDDLAARLWSISCELEKIADALDRRPVGQTDELVASKYTGVMRFREGGLLSTHYYINGELVSKERFDAPDRRPVGQMDDLGVRLRKMADCYIEGPLKRLLLEASNAFDRLEAA